MFCFLFKKKKSVLSYELPLDERIFLRENSALGGTISGGHNLENSSREFAVDEKRARLGS
jgi:hypothetical protein